MSLCYHTCSFVGPSSTGSFLHISRRVLARIWSCIAVNASLCSSIHLLFVFNKYLGSHRWAPCCDSAEGSIRPSCLPKSWSTESLLKLFSQAFDMWDEHRSYQWDSYKYICPLLIYLSHNHHSCLPSLTVVTSSRQACKLFVFLYNVKLLPSSAESQIIST